MGPIVLEAGDRAVVPFRDPPPVAPSAVTAEDVLAQLSRVKKIPPVQARPLIPRLEKPKRKRKNAELAEVATSTEAPFDSATKAKKGRTAADPPPETREATLSPSEENIAKAKRQAGKYLAMAKRNGNALGTWLYNMKRNRGHPSKWFEKDRIYFIDELRTLGNWCQNMTDQVEIAGARIENQSQIEAMFDSYRQLLAPVFAHPDAFKITRGELKMFSTFRGEKRQGTLEGVVERPAKKKSTQTSRAIVQHELNRGGNPSTGNEDNDEQPMLDLTKENGGV